MFTAFAYYSFQGTQNKMYIENNIGMPTNNFGIELYGNPLLANQNFQQFRGFGQGWEINSLSNTMIPSTSRIDEPFMAAEGSLSLDNQVVETNGNESNIEIRNEQSNFQTWYSEFEEMKNAERKKVIIYFQILIKYFIFTF